jgi:crotonobetainyl-CoA:carnitine CoA-transferase CaiB-like acyl-CoA transferase
MTHGPGNPIKLSRSNAESFTAAPGVGQNTDEVLSGLLGYDEARIDELKNKGAAG